MNSTRLLQVLIRGVSLARRWFFGPRAGTRKPVDEVTKRTNASQARFWAEFREGQREADARSSGAS
jgi:hypothetical protein